MSEKRSTRQTETRDSGNPEQDEEVRLCDGLMPTYEDAPVHRIFKGRKSSVLEEIFPEAPPEDR